MRLGGIARWREVRALSTRGQIVSRSPMVVWCGCSGLCCRCRAPSGHGSVRRRPAYGFPPGCGSALGWRLQRAPVIPAITVPRGRQLDRTRSPLTAAEVRVHWADIHRARWSTVTSPVRTVIDCHVPSTSVPMSVADSALRSGLVTSAECVRGVDVAPHRP